MHPENVSVGLSKEEVSLLKHEEGLTIVLSKITNIPSNIRNKGTLIFLRKL